MRGSFNEHPKHYHQSQKELLDSLIRQQGKKSYLGTVSNPTFIHHEPPESELRARGIHRVNDPKFLLAVNRPEHALVHFVRWQDLWRGVGDRASFISLTCQFTPEEIEIYEKLICSREIRRRVKADILERRRRYLK